MNDTRMMLAKSGTDYAVQDASRDRHYFTFGLLHGFGFAGALTEIGLPEHAILLALLFFNIGVEAGQLMFIAAVFLAWSVLRRIDWPEWAWRVPVYGIGTMAAFWTIERIAGF